MKRLFATGILLLIGLTLTSSSDAGGKKKKGDKTPEVPPSASSMPKYMKMLYAGNSQQRAEAIHKIGLRGMVNATDVLDAVDPIRKALERDSDANVRKEAARALGNIQPDPKDTVPLLTNTVKSDKVLDVRVAATVALGQYGAEAKEALPTLRKFAGEFKDAKKSKNAQTIKQAIKLISGKKK